MDAVGRTTTLLYDGADRVAGTYDALGHITSAVYDAAGRAFAVVDPLGNRTSLSYDAAGQLVAHTDPNGFVTTTVYDLAGRAMATVDPLGYRTTTTYDPDGNVVSLTDQNGHVTTAVYDQRGLATSSQDALGLWSYVQYDGAGNVVHRTDQRGWVSTLVIGTLFWTENAHALSCGESGITKRYKRQDNEWARRTRKMSPIVIEGTWEEILRHEAELTGRQLRVIIKPEQTVACEPSATDQNTTVSAQPSRRISAMGKYAGILSSDHYLRQKQEEIDLEDRARA